MTFDWNWEFAFEILPRLLRATINTLIARLKQSEMFLQ